MKNRIVAAVLIATLALSSCGKKANNDGAVNAPSATEDSQVTSPGDTQIDVSYIYEEYADMTPEDRKAMGKKGKEYVENNLPWSKLSEDFLKPFES